MESGQIYQIKNKQKKELRKVIPEKNKRYMGHRYYKKDEKDLNLIVVNQSSREHWPLVTTKKCLT